MGVEAPQRQNPKTLRCAEWALRVAPGTLRHWYCPRAAHLKPSLGNCPAWIVYINPATGHPQRIESLPTPEGPPGFRILSWSPTTDEIALTYPVGGKRYALAVVSLSGKPTEKLIEFEASTQGGLDWTPDGRRIVFSALAEGRMQIFVIDRRGGKPVQVTRDSNSLILPQVSPNGQWIAATRLLRAKELRRLRLP